MRFCSPELSVPYTHCIISHAPLANIEFRVLYSQWCLVLGLIGFVGLGLLLLLRLGLVGLALWLVSGTALNKYHCEYDNLNSMFSHFMGGYGHVEHKNDASWLKHCIMMGDKWNTQGTLGNLII